MYEESKLSDKAAEILAALKNNPPKFEAAEQLLADYTPTLEELTKIAMEIIDSSCPSDLQHKSIREIVEDDYETTYLYAVMKYLLNHGLDPNVIVDGGTDNPMFSFRFLEYPELLGARLMRLFLEYGGNPNLLCENETLFENVSCAVSYDEFLSRNSVYCWLVLMAYGGHYASSGEIPIEMKNGLDVCIFKRFEEYSYYEIVPADTGQAGFGNWNMYIYKSVCGDDARLVATYNTDAKKLWPFWSDKMIYLEETTPEEKTKIEKVPVSEAAFLQKIKNMYENGEVGDLELHLEEDFHYSSFWVFNEIASAEEYLEYATGKMVAIKKSGNRIAGELRKIKGEEKYALTITDTSKNDEAACLTVLLSEQGLIKRMDMMPANFYVFED